MSLFCPKAWQPIVTDADWDRPQPWRPYLNQLEADSRARLLDRPPPTTLGSVAGFTFRRTFRAINRHARAFVAAVRAYRGEMK